MATIVNARDVAIRATSPRTTLATGYNAVTAVLLAPVSVVSATNTGVVATLPTGNALRLYVGGTLQTTSVAFGPTSTTQNGLTAAISSSTGAITLTQSIWTTDQETFSFTATYNSIVYTQLYTISKTKGGVAGSGSNAISAVLTNDTTAVPTDSSGNGGLFNTPATATTLRVYNGAADDTGTWTISVTKTNVTCAEGTSNATQTVTAMSSDVGYIDFTATKVDYDAVYKRYIISKNKSGTVGTSPTSYWLVVSTAALSRSITNTYTPSTVVVTAYSQTGTGSPAPYAGRYKIYENGSGTAYYTSGASEALYTYTPTGSGLATIKVELYLADGTTKVDEQSVPVVSDGATGTTGNSVYTVELYSNVTTTPPAANAVSYNINTGILSGTPGSWTLDMPSSGITPTYMITYTINTATPGTAFPIPSWTTAVVSAVNGAPGSTGTSVYNLQLFNNVTSTPPTGVAYNISTNTLAGTLGSWSQTQPTVTTSPTYMVSALISTNTPASNFSISGFTSPVVVAQKGANGTGISGQSTHRAYYVSVNSATVPTTPETTILGAIPASWSATAYTSLTGSQAQFQSDGITPSGSTTTTWGSPYLSYFKVANLSAITTNTGALTVDNALTLGTNGYIVTSGAGYGSGSGVFLGWHAGNYKFSVGGLTFDGSLLTVPAARIDGTIPGTVTPPGTWYNGNITLNPNGTLNNAGTGQINLGSLAGTLVPGQIGDGSITTGKLLVTGRGKSLNEDPGFQDSTSWVIYTGTPGVSSFVNSTDAPVGARIARMVGGGHFYSTNRYPIQKSTRYKVSVWLRQTLATSGSVYVRCELANGTGAPTTFIVNAITPAIGNFENFVSVPSTWTKYTGYIDTGTTDATGRLQIYGNWYTASGTLEICDFRIEEYIGSDLIVDGAITASKIDVDNLSVIGNADLGNITAGAININNKAIITSAGEASFKGIQILDNSNNVILSAGSTNSLNFAYATPINVPTGWQNSQISISSTGVLSGGAGGTQQVVLGAGGLGYIGALDANKTYIDGSGLIQGVSSGIGTLVDNTKILVTGGVLGGIGTSGITVDNSYQTIGQNLIPNSDQTSAITWNVNGHNPNGATFDTLGQYAYLFWATTNYALAGTTTRNLTWHQSNIISGGDDAVALDIYPTGAWAYSSGIPVVPGQRYCFSVYLQGHRCKGGGGVYFWDATGATIWEGYSAETGPIALPYGEACALSQYNRISIFVTAPASAVVATPFIRKYNTLVGATESYFWAAAPQFEAVAANASSPSPYTAGPPTNTRQLGYIGALDATYGADWATSVTGASTVNTNISNAATTASWAGVYGPQKPSDNATADLILVTGGSACMVSGNTITSTSSNTWGYSGAYSKEGYSGGAFCSASFISADQKMFGLNIDPAANSNYTTIDYSFYHNGGDAVAAGWGNWGGSEVIAYNCVPSDIWSLVYDGATVKWLRNGIVLKTHTVADGVLPGITYYFDSALTGLTSITNIRFGPLSNNSWAGIGGSNKPQDNATWGAPGGTTVAGTEASLLVSTANTAKSTAEGAATTAGQAIDVLNDIASDAKFTPVEKQEVKRERDAIGTEEPLIDAQANYYEIYGGVHTTYLNAYNSLVSYIDPLLSSLTTTNDISGTTFRTMFNTYYNARQVLLNAIATEAGNRATWGGIPTGSGKPEDYATRGAPNDTYVGSILAQNVESTTGAQTKANTAKQDAIDAVTPSINNKLNKAGDTISGAIGFSTPTGFLVGNTTTGLYFGNSGFYGKSGGNIKFAIDTSGNATFGGTLAAPIGELGALDISTTGFIRGGQGTYNSGAGFWIGNNAGSWDFSIGDSTAANMRWKSSTGILTIQGAVLVSPVLTTPTYSDTLSVIIAGFNSVVGNNSVGTSGSASVTNSSGTITYLWTFSVEESHGDVMLSYGDRNTAQTFISLSGTRAEANIFITLAITDSSGRAAYAYSSTTLRTGEAF